jgi:predicted nucleic acid-binding protein
MTKIILDTNILVYAFDKDSEFHTEASKLIESTQELYIIYASMLEFYKVMTSKIYREKVSLELAKRAFKYLCRRLKILYPTPGTHTILSQLLEEHTILSGKIFDLQILAQAIEHNLDIIYTKNTKDFPKNQLVEIVDPL